MSAQQGDRRSDRDGDGLAWIAENETMTTSRGHRISYRRRGSGRPVLLVHGFPSWSYDYADVAQLLEATREVITLDLLGYGASDKPNPYDYSVAESADTVTELLAHLNLDTVDLVVHDYGGIVGQELLDRHARGTLPFAIGTVTLLNSGIVYSAYRPTTMQRLLIRPVIGALLAGRVSAGKLRRSLDAVRGSAAFADTEFANFWTGLSRENGHRIAHLLIRYNAERAAHHERWERALADWDGPLQLVWGLDDPVSGRHVLDAAVTRLPKARVTRLAGVGHFPQAEAPEAVAEAIG